MTKRITRVITIWREVKDRGKKRMCPEESMKEEILAVCCYGYHKWGPVTSASTQWMQVWETSREITSSCVSVEKLHQIEKCGGTAPMIKYCNSFLCKFFTSEDRSTQVTLWYVSVTYHLIRNTKTKPSLDTALSCTLVA